jgi:hypothetical protein
VQITIDGKTYPLPDDTDVVELRRRVAQAVFRCEVEQLHLADGHTMLVNWRSVRTIEIDTFPATGQSGHRVGANRQGPEGDQAVTNG